MIKIAITIIGTSEEMDLIGDNVETLGETPGDGVAEPIGAKIAIGMEVETKVTIGTRTGTETVTAEAAGDKVETGVHNRTTGTNHPLSSKLRTSMGIPIHAIPRICTTNKRW